MTFMLDEFANVALPDNHIVKKQRQRGMYIFLSLIHISDKAVKYYEKLRDKGENVYIDSLTYEQFMMLGDAEDVYKRQTLSKLCIISFSKTSYKHLDVYKRQR